jgi:hypothetical protein
MANPNILNATAIYGKTLGKAVAATATTIVANSVSSGKIFKINSLFISNVDGTNAADVTVDVYNGTTPYDIANAVTIPAGTAIDVLNKSIYLEEGFSLRTTASAASDLEAVASWEEIE